MIEMNEFLAKVPFDLYDLSVFEQVARCESFTRAAQEVGVTQSAVTRKIQAMEERLGLPLLERTTRSVRPTPAGSFLLEQGASLLNGVRDCLARLQAEFADGPKVVRVGISRSIALAHLPGLFHASLQKRPDVCYDLRCATGEALLRGLREDEMDIAVLCRPGSLPDYVQVTHRFSDSFTIIANAALAGEYLEIPRQRSASRLRWLKAQSWLLMIPDSNTGAQLREWMRKCRLEVEPAMNLDSFDLMIHLVSMGMGLSVVPVRALASYGRRKSVVRLPFRSRFERQLVVLARRGRQLPEYVQSFFDRILFQTANPSAK